MTTNFVMSKILFLIEIPIGSGDDLEAPAVCLQRPTVVGMNGKGGEDE